MRHLEYKGAALIKARRAQFSADDHRWPPPRDYDPNLSGHGGDDYHDAKFEERMRRYEEMRRNLERRDGASSRGGSYGETNSDENIYA